MKDEECPTCTIVVEWENFLFCDAWRPEAMLRQLRAQIAEVLGEPDDAWGPRERAVLSHLRGPIECVMAYEPTDFDVAAAKALVAMALGETPTIEVVWVAVSEGARYYEIKNEGAAAARNDWLVFVDSDVIPEAGWLRGLLGALADPAVALVGGGTYIEPLGLFDRAFALAWYFPPLGPAVPPHPHRVFHANNFAVRREIFLAYPFPSERARARGQCVTLASRLNADGHPVYRYNGAVVKHPRPTGLGNIVARGLSQGGDVGYELGPRAPILQVAAHAAYGTLKRYAWVTRNVLRDRRLVALPWWQVPGALAVLYAFYSLFGIGMVAQRLAPEAFRERFHF